VNRFQNLTRNTMLEPGKWYLFEWYIRLNTPGASDGVTRLWIDDASRPIPVQTLRMDYVDMRWLRRQDAGKQFGVLRLTVYDQRCDGVPNTCPRNGPRICHLPRNLEHEGFVRMRRTGDDLDAPRVEFDHEDRVVRDEAAERPHLGREEVRRHERSPMRSCATTSAARRSAECPRLSGPRLPGTALLATLIVLAHLAFVGFAALGSLLALQWPRVVWATVA
jgi:hypothetical protein